MKTLSEISSRLFKIGKKYSYFLVAMGLIILFFHQVIFSNKTFFFRDIHRWVYPMKYHLAKSLQEGVIPMWCANYFCGAPFISDLQSGDFYPLSFIFIFGSIAKSFNIFICIHLILGFIFIYHFIRATGLSAKTALFAGTAYCFGGYVLSSINTLNNLTTLIWLPAILWAITWALNEKKISGYFLAVLFTCMSILGGEPQLFLMSIVLVFFYCLIYSLYHSAFKHPFRLPILICIIVASSILITFVQIGPAYMDYKLSVRSGSIPYTDATMHSLSPNLIKHLYLPFKFTSEYITSPDSFRRLFKTSNGIPWLLSIYPGSMILPFALLGIISNFSKKAFFWLITFLCSLVLALGSHTPIYHLAYKIMPIFRYPEKFIFLTSFSLIIIAAYGFEKFLKLFKKKPLQNVIFSMLIFTLVFDLYYNHRNLNPFIEAEFYQTTHPDLKTIFEDKDLFRIYVDQDSFFMDSSKDSILKHHIMWQNMIFPNLGILHNVEQVNGTTGLELRYQYIITEILKIPWEDKIDFLKMANVKYIISAQELTKVSGMIDMLEKVNSHVYMIKGFLPRAWIVGALSSIKKGTMDELINPHFDYVQSAITNNPIINKYRTPFFEGVDQVTYTSNNKIQINATLKKPGILLLSESSFPGWKVFVDGEEKQCLWLNLLFQGVELDKGEHMVEFIYFPENFKLYAIISTISCFLFFLIWVYCCIISRRSQKSINRLSRND